MSHRVLAMSSFVGAMLLAAETGLAAGHADVAAIKAKLDAARPLERSSSTDYGSVGLIVFGVHDTRSFDAPARRKLISVAVSGVGDVAGYVLRKNGTPVCSFFGEYFAGCLSLSGCVSGTVCN
jgi:hypothetical protein